MAGDYNCGGIDWYNLDLHKEIPAQPYDRDLLELISKYGLTQHVKSPTRLVRVGHWILCFPTTQAMSKLIM